MQIISEPSEAKKHVIPATENGLVFNQEAVEIVILDRWGKAIWKKERGESVEPIRWDGIDFCGYKVGAGAFTCKITYPDKFVVYVPIMFFQP